MWVHHGCLRRLVVVLAWTAAALAARARIGSSSTFLRADSKRFIRTGGCFRLSRIRSRSTRRRSPATRVRRSSSSTETLWRPSFRSGWTSSPETAPSAGNVQIHR